MYRQPSLFRGFWNISYYTCSYITVDLTTFNCNFDYGLYGYIHFDVWGYVDRSFWYNVRAGGKDERCNLVSVGGGSGNRRPFCLRAGGGLTKADCNGLRRHKPVSPLSCGTINSLSIRSEPVQTANPCLCRCGKRTRTYGNVDNARLISYWWCCKAFATLSHLKKSPVETPISKEDFDYLYFHYLYLYFESSPPHKCDIKVG